jgi:hypothetical protein
MILAEHEIQSQDHRAQRESASRTFHDLIHDCGDETLKSSKSFRSKPREDGIQTSRIKDRRVKLLEGIDDIVIAG